MSDERKNYSEMEIWNLDKQPKKSSEAFTVSFFFDKLGSLPGADSSRVTYSVNVYVNKAIEAGVDFSKTYTKSFLKEVLEKVWARGWRAKYEQPLC